MENYNKSVVRCLLMTLYVLITVPTHLADAAFYCSGDICNKGSAQQFCSSYFNMCRHCADIVEDCGTDRQPFNCTSYCTTYMAELELQKIIKSSCSTFTKPANGFISPIPAKNGRFVIGTNVTITCEDNYILFGVQTMTCLGNNTWTGDKTPFCLDTSYILWQNVGKGLAISFAIVLITVLPSIICQLHRRRKKTTEGQRDKEDSDSFSESGIESSFTEQNEMSLLLIDESILKQQLNMADKCVGTETSQTKSSQTKEANSISSSTDTPLLPSSTRVIDCKPCPNYQPSGSAVTFNFTLNQIQEKNIIQQNDSTTHQDIEGANTKKDKSDEIEERLDNEKQPTEATQITTEARQETRTSKISRQGPETLPSRKKSVSTPNTGANMVAEKLKTDTNETNENEHKVVGLKDRTFLSSDAQKK